MTFSSKSWTWPFSETLMLKTLLQSPEAEQKNQQDGTNHNMHIAGILGLFWVGNLEIKTQIPFKVFAPAFLQNRATHHSVSDVDLAFK